MHEIVESNHSNNTWNSRDSLDNSASSVTADITAGLQLGQPEVLGECSDRGQFVCLLVA